MSSNRSRSMRASRAAAFIVVASILKGCGGTSDPGPEVLRVGGTYTTQVSLTQNTCTGLTVQPLQTVVGHTPGATSLSVQHGPVNYTGTVTAAGAFSTTPATVQGAGAGDRTTLSVAGQFSTTGFIADVTAAVTLSNVPACNYTVRWVGTKLGAANTVP